MTDTSLEVLETERVGEPQMEGNSMEVNVPIDPAKAAVRDRVVADLMQESADLRDLLAGLAESDWTKPTPAAGWSIGDQVTHLAFFDDSTTSAMTDREEFLLERAMLLSHGDAFPDVVADLYRGLSAEEGIAWFERSRARLLDAFRAADPSARLPWFGPDMSVVSSATARLMESWAHGQDIADALGVERTPTARLRHVADLGVRTLGFAFRLRERPVPTVPVWVELTAPSGELWTWGDSDATDTVRGSALDFCLVVTQRRNPADTTLQIDGTTATEWISIAQAYAGAPGPGRPAVVSSGVEGESA